MSLANIQSKHEILSFVLPKVCILTVLDPNFSRVVDVIGSKTIGVSSTLATKFPLFSISIFQYLSYLLYFHMKMNLFLLNNFLVKFEKFSLVF